MTQDTATLTPVAAAAAQLTTPPSPAFADNLEPSAPAPLVVHAPPPIVARHPRSDLMPENLDEAYRLAEYLADSTMVPEDYQGKPGNVLVAIQWGLEIGMKPLQAMQNIAVINGRPSLWGDAMLALVSAHPSCVDIIERFEGTGDNRTAICVAKRRGREDKIGEFSVADARTAELLGKGTWKKYRDRMLKMRARAFALRDQFTDVLKGLASAEEQSDIEPTSYYADRGPDSRLDGGSTRPVNVKGSTLAAGHAPQLTEDGAAEIVRLTRIAKTEGYAKYRAEWMALTEDMRAEIGIPKRNEMSALAAEFDTRRKGEATDAVVKGEEARVTA